MPDVESYTFSHSELLALLIREAKVKDGDWQLQVNFGFSAGNFGPDDQNMNPGSVAIIVNVGITKAKPDSPRGLTMSAKAATSTPTA